MRILVVCSHKEGYPGNLAPFVREQMDAVRAKGTECDLFLVKGKGVRGYLGNFKALKRKIKSFHPDVVHAHYGLCGLLANFQRKVPVVTTYHGSDINERKARFFSKLAMRLSKWNVFVSQGIINIARPHRHFSLIPCGVDLDELQLTGKKEARTRLQLDEAKRYVLFAGAFDNPVKGPELTREAVALLHDGKAELLELKGYSREEVTMMMCAADVVMMTSVSEGSPQVIKEAMACGCPIVSVDVGDVKERTEGVEGCYLSATRNPDELAELLGKAMHFQDKTHGREKIGLDGLDNRLVAERLLQIYRNVLKCKP